jgi:hypothetical protein
VCPLSLEQPFPLHVLTALPARRCGALQTLQRQLAEIEEQVAVQRDLLARTKRARDRVRTDNDR